jgi:hypothetical protein
MAKPKKNTLHQILVPMVDGTDFASVESGITESDFNSGVTKKFYGVNTGGSAATTSGTISKLASLVRSGVFRITLKATENNYDLMMVRVNKTGCAEQIMTWENVDNDDSDIMSALTLIQSMASDAASAAQQANSRVLVNQSFLSDIRSHVSDLQSDFQSRVPKAVATNSQLSDLASDVKSAVLLTQSMASDAASAAAQANSRVLLVLSQTSDLASKLSDVESNLLSVLTTTGVQLNASVMSDLRSAVAAVTVNLTASDISDIASAVAAAVTTITQSDISNIVSAMRADLASDLSDILSAARQGASQTLLVKSLASDTHSAVLLVQSMASDAASAAQQVNSRVLLVQSMASDAASAAQQTNSRVLLNQSRISDIYSLLSDLHSDVGVLSGVVSDITSALAAGVPLGASDLSDLRSAIAAHGVQRAGVEPTAVPAHTAALADKVDWLTALTKNKIIQTANVQTLRNAVDGADIASAPVTNNSTSTVRGAWS